MNTLPTRAAAGIQPAAPEPSRTDGKTGREKTGLFGACRAFETVLVSRMVSAMKSTLPGGGFLNGLPGGAFFESIMDTEIASGMTSRGTFGLASALFRQVTGREPQPEEVAAARNTPADSLLRSGGRLPPAGPGPARPVSPSPAQPGGITGSYAGAVMEKVLTFMPEIEKACKAFGISRALVASVIAQESAGNPDAVSHAGAAGLMQLMTETARELGVSDRFDPADNIKGGTAYLRKMLDRYRNDMDLALAAYNSGPGSVDRYGGIPPYKETKAYVDKIKRWHFMFTEKMRGGERCLDPRNGS